MFCPKCGAANPEGRNFCSSCGGPLQIIGAVNTSGMGRLAQIPPEVRGWNWGGFWWGWIWGIGNSVWIALLGLIPIVSLVMMFVLGAKGSEWAWTARKWESIEHFKRVQRNWALAGWILFIIGVLFWVAYFALAVCVMTTIEAIP